MRYFIKPEGSGIGFVCDGCQFNMYEIRMYIIISILKFICIYLIFCLFYKENNNISIPTYYEKKTFCFELFTMYSYTYFCTYIYNTYNYAEPNQSI